MHNYFAMPFRKYFFNLRYFDWVLFFSVLLLLSFGLSALYGIAQSDESPDFGNLKKQIMFAVIGLVMLFVMSFFDYNVFRSYAFIAYIVFAVILVYVLFFGKVLRGTSGWIQISIFNFQPVELAKLVLMIMLAKICVVSAYNEKNLLFIARTGVYAFIYFSLVMFQPDFGSALILFLLWFGIIILSGVGKKYIISVIAIFLIFFAMGWLFFFQDYQKDRMATFFQPMSDPLGRGYHVRQSVIAIGSGNIFGKGLASGSQSQLKFIPASQTDFIFAVISEELGFLGSTIVLFLYCVVLYRIIRIAQRASDDFASFLALGVSVIFFSQIIINIGMNLGIMPVTGIGLPFISYGGSLLVVSMLFIGIVQGISIRSIKYKT